MRYPVGEEIHITPDSELERLVDLEFKWRQNLKRGGQVSQVIQIIEENGGRMKLNDLKIRLTDFQLDYMQSSAVLQDMIKSRILLFNPKDNMISYEGAKKA
jgi:hypothetical protein